MINSTPTHEAGHAVVAELLGIRVLSIEYENINTGSVEVEDCSDQRKLAMVALGGIMAVDLFLGPLELAMEDQDGDDCDLPMARLHARRALGEGGDVDAYLESLRLDVVELLRPHEQVIRTLAKEMVAHRGLPGDEVRRIIAEGLAR